jgi:Tol biopolymer transport system component
MVHHAYLSPDGKWVLIVEMDNRGMVQPCRVVPFDGSGTEKLVGPNGVCLGGAWSPDGKYVYVTAKTDAFHIWRQAFPDGTPEQITFGPTSQVGLAMAPDGKSAVTAVGTDDNTLWLHDSDGDHQISSEGSAEDPSYSADGSTLYFLMVNGQTQKHELWKRDMASGEQEKVLPGYSMQAYSVSHDGQFVAFTVTDSTGHAGVWVAPMDRGSSPVKLSASGNDEDSPHFLPNNDLIFRLIEKDHSYAYRMKMDGSSREKISDNAILDLGSVSRDGRWIVAVSSPTNRRDAFGTRAIPVTGGQPIALCRTYCDVAWDASGKSLFIVFDNGSYALPIARDTGLPKLPDAGFDSAADLKKNKSLAEAPVAVQSALNPTTYVYVRRTTRRNLYRIPLP